MAKDLINAGADVNAKRNDGFTPLHVAVKNNQPRMTELLVKYMTDLDVQEVNPGDRCDRFVLRNTQRASDDR